MAVAGAHPAEVAAHRDAGGGGGGLRGREPGGADPAGGAAFGEAGWWPRTTISATPTGWSRQTGELYLIDLESMSLDDPALDIGATLWWYYPPELRQRFLEIAGQASDEPLPIPHGRAHGDALPGYRPAAPAELRRVQRGIVCRMAGRFQGGVGGEGKSAGILGFGMGRDADENSVMTALNPTLATGLPIML